MKENGKLYALNTSSSRKLPYYPLDWRLSRP